MGLEQRGRADQGDADANPAGEERREEPKHKVKSFDIPKRLVLRAWEKVRAKFGIPFGVAIDGANRNDSILLAPTLDDAAKLGLLKDIETLWLVRGYDSQSTIERLVEREINDSVTAKKRKRGEAKAKNPQPMGIHWLVERTNASGSSAAIPIARSATDSLSSPSRSSSSSPPSSSTGVTAGHRSRRLSAELLRSDVGNGPIMLRRLVAWS